MFDPSDALYTRRAVDEPPTMHVQTCMAPVAALVHGLRAQGSGQAVRSLDDLISISPKVYQYLFYVYFRCLHTAVLGGLQTRLLHKYL